MQRHYLSDLTLSSVHACEALPCLWHQSVWLQLLENGPSALRIGQQCPQ